MDRGTNGGENCWREGGREKQIEGSLGGWNDCWMKGWMQIQVDGGINRKI